MWDAIVGGAGPAGAVATYMLARNRRRVLLCDAIGPEGHKVGEALPGAALRLLRAMDLPLPCPEGPHMRIGGNLFAWSSDELWATDFIHDPDGPGWRLDRLRFDEDLRAAAVSAGATFRPARVRDIAREDDGWRLRLDDGATESARWVIDATGRRAALARRLGARRRRDAAQIALYALGSPAAELRLSRTVIEAVPRGWWYAARLPSGAVLAGLHVRPREAARLLADPDAWHRALAETRHVGPMLATTVFDRPLRVLEACGARLDRFGGDGWIACGDAALSFDPISGQGIFSALHGGMTAGRVPAAALDGDDTAFEAYAARLEKIREVYRAHTRSIYRDESRWATEPFWATA